jgi:hypothetical protein
MQLWQTTDADSGGNHQVAEIHLVPGMTHCDTSVGYVKKDADYARVVQEVRIHVMQEIHH